VRPCGDVSELLLMEEETSKSRGECSLVFIRSSVGESSRGASDKFCKHVLSPEGEDFSARGGGGREITRAALAVGGEG